MFPLEASERIDLSAFRLEDVHFTSVFAAQGTQNDHSGPHKVHLGPIPPSDCANLAQIGAIQPSDSANIDKNDQIPPSDNANLAQIGPMPPSDNANMAKIDPIPLGHCQHGRDRSNSTLG